MGRYIALKPLSIAGEVRTPGEDVPEVTGWRTTTVESLVRAGDLDYLPDEGETYHGPRANERYVAGRFRTPELRAPVPEEAVPDGTVNVIMDWVGTSPDRAMAAWYKENEAEEPRVTLLTKLETIADE